MLFLPGQIRIAMEAYSWLPPSGCGHCPAHISVGSVTSLKAVVLDGPEEKPEEVLYERGAVEGKAADPLTPNPSHDK